MKIEAYYWSVVLFKIQHYINSQTPWNRFFTLQFQLKCSAAVSCFSDRRPSYESHKAWICSSTSPQVLHMSLDTELGHWSWERHWPREGGPGVHLRISVSFFTWTSLLRSHHWNPHWSSQRQPSLLPWASCCLSIPFVPLRFPHPNSGCIFLLPFYFSSYHKRNSQFNFTQCITILSERFKAAKWTQMSKQESDTGPGQTRLKKHQPKARQGHQSAPYVLAYNGQLYRPD